MKIFSNLSIVKKLILAFFVLSLFWSAICGISFKFMLDIKASYSQLIDQQATALVNTKEIQHHVISQNYALVAYMAATGAGALGDQKSMQLLKNSNQQIHLLIAQTANLLESQDDKNLLMKIEETNKQYKQTADLVVKTSETNRKKAEVMMQSEVVNLSNNMMAKANQIADKQKKLMAEKEAANTAQVYHVIMIVLTICIITLLAAILISYFAARKMTRPLAQMVVHTEQIAAGNLGMKPWAASTGDEIGKLSINFNKMTANLTELIKRIADGSNEIGGSIHKWQQSADGTALASRHIAEIMQEVQTAVVEQMHNVEKTNQNAVEMSSGIRQITKRASRSAEQASEILQMSQKGTEEMNMTASQMDTICKTVISLQTTVQDLGTKTEHIGQIVGIISDIAKQTNILAINASIEASRAGTHGQGFKVIANEVRQLSTQTSKSAEDISRYIEEIVFNTQKTENLVKNSIKEVEQGISAVGGAESTFTAIQQAMDLFSEDIQGVSAAALQIESLTEQVVQSIGHINEKSQLTSHRTQEVSAATEQQLASMEDIVGSVRGLAELAQGLQQTARNFKW